VNDHAAASTRPERDYYRRVADYYDEEAAVFEQHYRNNAILQRIRIDFRDITERYPFDSALEIGCGPGIDLAYWAERFPQRTFLGIDVSPAMVQQARAKIAGLANVTASSGTLWSLSEQSSGRFDLIYCYFGALNTEPDLAATARLLASLLNANGTMVLTFVNRWYLFDIIWNLLRLRWRRAFARPLDTWRGYAPDRPLPSFCHSAREIQKAFHPYFELKKRKGYSIVFPAWYRQKFVSTDGRLGRCLWNIDGWINRTPFWNLGEYSLYVFSAKE